MGALACSNSINDIWVAGARSTYQDATLLHLLVCPVYLHGTPLREGSEFEDGCLPLKVGISCERIQTYSHEKRVNGVDNWFCA